MLIVFALAMAFVLGFSAHRAGICTVKAVAEIITSRQGWMLWFFLRAALWSTAILTVAALAGIAPPLYRQDAMLVSVLGGVLFGIGAGLNGGCTYSTVTRAADGNVKFLATVVGWPIGMLAGSRLPVLSAGDNAVAFTLPLVAVVLLIAFVAYEAGRLARRLSGPPGPAVRIASPVYTLSAAAAIIGLANAVIVLTAGGWSFTGTVLRTLRYAECADCAAPVIPWLLFLAAVAGMVGSALQRRSFKLRAASPGAIARHALAGVVMGVGATLIPGGNDSLILFAIPSLSPHAVPAYLGLLVGIAVALAMAKLAGEAPSQVVCTGDICRTL